MKLILLGPPGAGKGTQAIRIAESISVPHVASGDLFRDHQKRGTQLGVLAKDYMEKGLYVPDEVTIGMVMEWVEMHQCDGGFLLDGFPRTLGQAEALEMTMNQRGGIQRALNIKVRRDELIRRLTDRMICRGCQKPYSRQGESDNPINECLSCGDELYRRPDDEPRAVQKRLEVYAEETEPLVSYYKNAGILRNIDGHGSVEDVERVALAALVE